MIKRLISVLLALTVVLSAFAALPADVAAAADGTGSYKIVTQKDPLTIRAKASTSGDRKGSVPKGAVVEVTEVSANWGKVTYKGATGWICLDFAEKQSGSTTTTSTTKPADSGSYATVEPSSIASRLNELRAKFPNGKYWNHYGSKEKNLDGWTNTPCPSGHYLNGVMQCNGQCDGFARKLGLDLFGDLTYNSPWENASFNINTLCVGDIFRYNGKHTVMIVGFTESTDKLIIADCNWDYHCKIRWDATFSISRYVRSVNWVRHYKGNNYTRDVFLNKPPKTTTTPAPTTTTRPQPKVVLNYAEYTLPVKSEVTLTASLVPAADGEFTWTSSDKAIATVSGGKVTAVAPGTATITAKSGEASASCKVTVTDSIAIKRINGSDRISTAVEISKAGWTNGSTANVILASAYSFADALAGVPLSKALDAPVLLTAGKDTLEAGVVSQLEALGAKNVYILGGDKVISGGIEKTLTDKKYAVTRLAGGSRYETAVRIAEKLVELKGCSGTVYISNAFSFPDALSAGPAAAIEGCPILYTASNGTPDKATSDFLTAQKYTRARLVGGTAVISDKIKDGLKPCGIETTVRLSGANRYETCLAAIKSSENHFTGTDIAIATGADFPDALAGGALAAKLGIPLVLATSAPAQPMKDWLHAKNPASLYIFGGTAAVSDAAAYQYTA